MLYLLLTFAYSLTINTTGYYNPHVDPTGTTIEFNLPDKRDGFYYIAFVNKDPSLHFNSTSINNSVYKIIELNAKYIATVSSGNIINFGVFLAPKIL